MKYELEFLNIVNDLLKNELVKDMKKYPHHFDTNCYGHSLNVAYISYLKAKEKGLDYKSVARAGLLHDLYLYDWHNYKGKLHGPNHPKTAYKNAKKITKLNDIEKDIITKHMWPLTLTPPKYKESWIVSTTDKLCAINDYLTYRKKYKRHNKLTTLASTLLIMIIIKL